jgi:hypothetical protein
LFGNFLTTEAQREDEVTERREKREERRVKSEE